MSKLDKYKVQHTIGGGISIVELEKEQSIEGFSLLKDKSIDKSNETILAVMSFLEQHIGNNETSITVESELGKLSFEKVVK